MQDGEGYFSESNIKLKSLVMGNAKQGSRTLKHSFKSCPPQLICQFSIS